MIMPSIYSGCTIEDTFDTALSEYRKSLEEARKTGMEQIEALGPVLDALTSAKETASVIIGTSSSDNQIEWTAVEEGEEGNSILIYYDYLGPIWDGVSFQDRPPSSYVDSSNPNHIHCILAVDSTAAIDPNYPVNACLPIWISDPDVQELVTASVIGTGAGLPEVVTGTSLGGGKGSPLTDAEEEANNIARVFGKTSYQDLLRDFDVPVIEDAATAKTFLNGESSDYVIVGDKLLLIEGTNLVAIRALYRALDEDLTKLKSHLTTLEENLEKFSWVMTRNLSISTTELVCGIPETVVEVKEEYLATNTNIESIANSTNTDLEAINNYIFWSVYINPTTHNHQSLFSLGMPTEYYEAIFSGVDATQDSALLIQAPKVYLVEDPTLLNQLQLSEAELAELLDNDAVPGIKTEANTSVDELVTVTNNLLNSTRDLLQNGLGNKNKNPIAASQTLDLPSTFQDSNRSKELAARGKACARQSSFFPEDTTADLPNLSFPELPSGAKQIESMYGAISNAVNASTNVFDSLWKGLTTLLSPVLNKIQNLNSLADNLDNNNLAECGLGVGQPLTGFPQLGGGGVNPTGGGLGGGLTPSIGGIPVPVDQFKKFMTELSGKVNGTLTNAISEIIKTINVPICMAQQLLSTITGASTDTETNPCKEPSDPDETCPPPDIQEVANESSELSQSLNLLPQLQNETLSSSTTYVSENVEEFTGRLNQFTVTVEESITRGIKTVVDELWKSFDTKLELLDKFDQAVQSMGTDTQETALTGGDTQQTQQSCNPPSVGFFADAITELL